MLKLYGFSRSNYFNTVKMALLEKAADFEEVKTFPSQEDDYLPKSPMGKVPCLETPHGFLSETSAILDYIDETVDGPSLYPEDPWERAQTRELLKQLELYLDLAARPCFPEAFFGGSVSDEVKETAKKNLQAGLAAINRRARFSPYVAGGEFTAADIFAYFALPLAAGVANQLLGLDLVAALPGAKEMLAKVAERESAKTIAATQKS